MTSPTGPVLILGGRSDIGLACAHSFAEAGHPVWLAARNSASLEAAKTDIELRHGVSAQLFDFDALNLSAHEAFVDALPELPQVVICAVGAMGEQFENEKDVEKAAQVMRANFEGPATLLGVFANRFEARGSGTIVGISSVAGDRGRATNYVYGAAKAGFTAFLSGLRNRLAKAGVHVVTVKPGFVATSMTEGMDLPEKLTAQPSELGKAVLSAIQRGRNEIYVRRIWWMVMMIIRNIPEMVFKKLSI